MDNQNQKKPKKIFKQNQQFLLFFICIFGLWSLVFTTSKAFASPITESRLIQLTNQERQVRGLNILTPNSLLYFAAKDKAKDMIEKDYFEHYTPSGQSPWDFIHSFNYNYLMAGENLAMDFKTSEGIHAAWMASDSHRANILRPEYEDIAIVAEVGEFNDHQTTVVVQMFGKQNKSLLNINNFVFRIRDFILGFNLNQ